MQVLGIGNVTECNKIYIFLNNEGKQDRIRANPELLAHIRDTASRDRVFYARMWEEINELYEKKKVDVEAKYQFITDEMVEDAYKRSRKEGFDLDIMKDTHNMECVRQFSTLHGMYGGANFASDRRWQAEKLLVEAEMALKSFR